jgi:cyclase
MRKKE